MPVIMTPLAERDLESIGDFIAEDNPVRAISFVAELRAQCIKIAKGPQSYRLRHELGNGIRACAYGNYVIFFTANKAQLTIARVLHGAMDIPVRFSDPDGLSVD